MVNDRPEAETKILTVDGRHLMEDGINIMDLFRIEMKMGAS